MYTLYVAVIISGYIHESAWKTFDRFEECWEVAEMITHNRPTVTARCVRMEKTDDERRP